MPSAATSCTPAERFFNFLLQPRATYRADARDITGYRQLRYYAHITRAADFDVGDAAALL